MTQSENGHSGKYVRAVLEIGTNYLFHLLAIARTGFDSEYADKYIDSVRPGDLALLQELKDKLSFGGGTGGELLDIFMLPAAFALQSKNDFEIYYKLILDGCDRNDFSAFLETYDAPIRKLKQWAGHPDNDAMRECIPYRNKIARLMETTVANYDSYVENVWPEEKLAVEQVANVINEVYENHDRIGQWEAVTGLTFTFDMYKILLCSAIKNGPDANSLGYDRVVFYHGSPLDRICDFISHEIGTHIFMEDIKVIRNSNTIEWPALYEGFECLAMYYNTLVLGRTDLHYTLRNYHVDDYMTIYGDLRRENPEISVREMLEQGIRQIGDIQRN